MQLCARLHDKTEQRSRRAFKIGARGAKALKIKGKGKK